MMTLNDHRSALPFGNASFSLSAARSAFSASGAKTHASGSRFLHRALYSSTIADVALAFRNRSRASSMAGIDGGTPSSANRESMRCTSSAVSAGKGSEDRLTSRSPLAAPRICLGESE